MRQDLQGERLPVKGPGSTARVGRRCPTAVKMVLWGRLMYETLRRSVRYVDAFFDLMMSKKSQDWRSGKEVSHYRER